jgi:quinol monooxygenase YgiN
MSVVVVATVYPIPEHRDEVIAAFTDTIAAVHAHDEGCQLYALHEGEDRLVVIEKWVSRDALVAHGQGTAMVQFRTRLSGKIIGGVEVQVLTPHPAGSPEQGTL